MVKRGDRPCLRAFCQGLLFEAVTEQRRTNGENELNGQFS